MLRILGAAIVAAVIACVAGGVLSRGGVAPASADVPGFPPGFSVALDCDPGTAGVQADCTRIVGAQPFDVDFLLVNNTASSTLLSSFSFIAKNPDTSRLVPLPGPAVSDEGNPDLDDTLDATWHCSISIPDAGFYGPGTSASRIGCNDDVPPYTESVGAGTTRVLAKVRYSVPPLADPGDVTLSLNEVSAYDNTFTELGTCSPTIGVPFAACAGATLHLIPAPPGSTATFTPLPSATPTPTSPATATPTSAGVGATPTSTPVDIYFALDCDTLTPGLQVTCAYPSIPGPLDVGVWFFNNTGSDVRLTSPGMKIYNPDTTRLSPLPNVDSNFNGNPDFNEADLTSVFICSSPPPNPNNGSGGPGTSVSFLSCFTGLAGPPIPAGAGVRLATVHYAVPSGALPGAVTLTLRDMSLYDDSYSEIGSCAPVISAPATCLSTTITFVTPPTATATNTPTFTATPTPPLGITKIPEGNAANTDPSIPAANLWLCVAPAACAGPGEGELRIVEHATNVRSDYDADGVGDTADPDIEGTGLANAELGLGAYEFTVEYDNFVIQSVNPCDIVFGPTGIGSARGPVDEANSSSPENADCAPDPGMGAPGTCAMSLVLENLIRFGCVTGGQALGPSGNMDLASLVLVPHPDLRNDIFPGNSNGAVTVLKDNGCELADILGHPMLFSVNGGLTPVCGDLAVTVRILEGDMNLDCTVDVTDEQLISFRYGAFFGDLFYQKWYDLEPALHDLDIDIKDLQKVFGRDGSSCQAPIPDQPPQPPPAPFG